MYKYYYSIYVDGIDTSFFTYSYFEELNIGQWVKINFAGRNKFGLVISKEEKKEFEFEVREIIEEQIIEHRKISAERKHQKDKCNYRHRLSRNIFFEVVKYSNEREHKSNYSEIHGISCEWHLPPV